MKIKYCIFDIGNVCYPYSFVQLNNRVRELVSDKEAFDKAGGLGSFDFDPLLKGEVSFTQFCKDLCAQYHIPYQKQIEIVLNAADHACLGSFFEVTKQLMSELRAQGIEIGLLSNITPDLEDIVPDIVDKDKCFLSYEMGLIKPDPEIYKLVIQKLKAQPQEILFIDDKPQNIEAAQELGINGIVFNKDTIVQEVQKFLS